MRSLLNGKYTFGLNDVLGSGAFGHVYTCSNTQTGEKLALKRIAKSKMESFGDYMKVAL